MAVRINTLFYTWILGNNNILSATQKISWVSDAKHSIIEFCASVIHLKLTIFRGEYLQSFASYARVTKVLFPRLYYYHYVIRSLINSILHDPIPISIAGFTSLNLIPVQLLRNLIRLVVAPVAAAAHFRPGHFVFSQHRLFPTGLFHLVIIFISRCIVTLIFTVIVSLVSYHCCLRCRTTAAAEDHIYHLNLLHVENSVLVNHSCWNRRSYRWLDCPSLLCLPLDPGNFPELTLGHLFCTGLQEVTCNGGSKSLKAPHINQSINRFLPQFVAGFTVTLLVLGSQKKT